MLPSTRKDTTPNLPSPPSFDGYFYQQTSNELLCTWPKLQQEEIKMLSVEISFSWYVALVEITDDEYWNAFVNENRRVPGGTLPNADIA